VRNIPKVFYFRSDSSSKYGRQHNFYNALKNVLLRVTRNIFLHYLIPSSSPHPLGPVLLAFSVF